MTRKTLLVTGLLVTGCAGGVITVVTFSASHVPVSGPQSDVGVAGPLGPQGISVVPSYFKRVTFSAEQIGQAQQIAAHLPAGKYLVEVRAPSAPTGNGSDCLGVAFPLSQSLHNERDFTGYVSVAHGDAATVFCYAQTAKSSTYELFYIPVTSAA